MDTLVPAQEKYQSAIGAGSDFNQALEQMADAAEQGRESTRDLVAKIGRASRLGERSRGKLDAGATSCALILQTFAKVLSGASEITVFVPKGHVGFIPTCPPKFRMTKEEGIRTNFALRTKSDSL
jgi:dihydroxyacetone kinase